MIFVELTDKKIEIMSKELLDSIDKSYKNGVWTTSEENHIKLRKTDAFREIADDVKSNLDGMYELPKSFEQDLSIIVFQVFMNDSLSSSYYDLTDTDTREMIYMEVVKLCK